METIESDYRGHSYLITINQVQDEHANENQITVEVSFTLDNKPIFVEWDQLFIECQARHSIENLDGAESCIIEYIDRVDPNISWHERYTTDIERAKQYIKNIEKQLANKIGFYELSSISKLPLKACSAYEALMYRTYELGSSATLLIENRKAVSAAVIIRALSENSALIYDMFRKLNIVVESRLLGNIDDYLMKVMYGNRQERLPFSVYKATNIITLIEHIDKKFVGYKENYEYMCEYAHPNSNGVKIAYSRLDFDNSCELLGIDDSDRRLCEWLNHLLWALEVFQFYYKEVKKLMPAFVKICEDDILNGKAAT